MRKEGARKEGMRKRGSKKGGNEERREGRNKGWRMSCHVGEATESLENQNVL